MAHSVFLLLFIVVAAPLATFIPLAALAGVLVVVAWNMIERNAIATLLRSRGGDAAVMLTTFLLTIFVGLSEAIVVGFALGAILFIHRMAQSTEVAAHMPLVEDADRADTPSALRRPYDESLAANPEVVVYRITGAFFFGAAAAIGAVLERISAQHRTLIVDFAAVPFLDATAANTIEGFARKAAKRHVRVVLTGTNDEVRQELLVHGIKPPLAHLEHTIEAALAKLERDPTRTARDGSVEEGTGGGRPSPIDRTD
jgi:SulP family sulfate permease